MMRTTFPMFHLSHDTIHAHRALFALLAVCVWGCLAGVAHAAQVQMAPASGSYQSGETFTVTVEAAPEGEDINAVEADLSFDSSRLSVVSLSKSGSVFSLWTTEPEFSNSAGTITFGGGSPTPFSSPSTLLTITFRANAEGDAPVSVSSASALAADGQGTDVYSGSVDANYSIAAAQTQEPQAPPEESAPPEDTAQDESGEGDAITFGEPPRAPEVGSQTFLDPEEWYATRVCLPGSFPSMSRPSRSI